MISGSNLQGAILIMYHKNVSAPLHSSSQAVGKTLPSHVCCSFPLHGLELHGCSTCEAMMTPLRVVFERLIYSKHVHAKQGSRAGCVYTLRYWVMSFEIAHISCASESKQQQQQYVCNNSHFILHDIENYNRRMGIISFTELYWSIASSRFLMRATRGLLPTHHPAHVGIRNYSHT